MRMTLPNPPFLAALLLFVSPWLGAAAEPDKAAAPEPGRFFQRHLRFLDAYGAGRYIYVRNREGVARTNDLQYRFQLKGQWRFDPAAKTYLQFRLESGNSFPMSWNFSGWGRADHNLSVSLKDLFVGQKLGSYGEVQVGGIEFDRGAGTEATFADDDGFQVGYRLSVSPPRGWWPSRMQVTVSRIDEFHYPSVFARLPGLGEANAVQALAQKAVGENVQLSAEFDRISGINLERVALRWTPSAWLDRLTLETIVRSSDNPSGGYSLQLARAFKPAGPWNLAVTYSHLAAGVFAHEGGRILFNGDQVNLGQRLGFQVSRPLGRGFALTAFLSRQLDHTPSLPGQSHWRFHLAFSYRFVDRLNPRPRN